MELELHLIINYQAGSGNGAKVADLILAALNKKAVPHHVYSTDYQGHGIDIAKELLATTLEPWSETTENSALFPLLVVVGGDGTLHEVVNALDENLAIPIGYIPAGSGNDFARGISLSREPLVALDHLLAQKTPQSYTIIKYVEAFHNKIGYFTNNLGIGIDAAIVNRANLSKSKQTLNKFKMGSMTYLSSALSVLFKQKGFPLNVSTKDGEVQFDNAFLCTTTNHPYFGGGIAIAPDADPKKAEMELVVIERINIFIIFHLITLLLRKKHFQSKHVYHLVSDKIRLVSSTQQYAQTDGEILGNMPYDLTFTPEKRLFWL